MLGGLALTGYKAHFVQLNALMHHLTLVTENGTIA
jgi:hypothetical protein